MLANVDVSQPVVQAICLTPTRELAAQIIKDAVAPMAKRMPGLTYELLVKEQAGEVYISTTDFVIFSLVIVLLFCCCYS